MKNICLFFQIHHPFNFQTFRFFDIGTPKSYYDDLRVEQEIHEAAMNYYLPTNEFLLKLIRQSKNKLKLSFSISGTSLDQFLIYAPKLFDSFRRLSDTGLVEFTGGTNAHSIISLADKNEEFLWEVEQHNKRIQNYFGQTPKVFVNTDLLYSNQIAKVISENGFSAILTNGTKKALHWRSPNYLYSVENHKKTKVLFRNEGISNELSLILQNPKATQRQANEEKLSAIFNVIQPEEPIINIYLNYLNLGGIGINEKQHFFNTFINKIIKDESYHFSLPTEVFKLYAPVAEVGTEEPICWSENFHSSYFPGNELQKDAIKQLFKLQNRVSCTKDPNLQIDWKYLQTSDHFHLMDENHPIYRHYGSNYGNYKSKYDAYINYMNILEDFRQRLKADRKINKSAQLAKNQSTVQALN